MCVEPTAPEIASTVHIRRAHPRLPTIVSSLLIVGGCFCITASQTSETLPHSLHTPYTCLYPSNLQKEPRTQYGLGNWGHFVKCHREQFFFTLIEVVPGSHGALPGTHRLGLPWSRGSPAALRWSGWCRSACHRACQISWPPHECARLGRQRSRSLQLAAWFSGGAELT